MRGEAIGARGFDIGQVIIDEYCSVRCQPKPGQGQLINGGIRLDQFFTPRNHDIAEMGENWLCGIKAIPKLRPEIGDRKKRGVPVSKLFNNFEAAHNRARNRLVEPLRVGLDMRRIIGKQLYQLGPHLRERLSGIMLEMPFGRDDFGQKPIELFAIRDQLFKQMTQVPAEQHIADIENHAAQFGHSSAPARKKPPAIVSGRLSLSMIHHGRIGNEGLVSPDAP